MTVVLIIGLIIIITLLIVFILFLVYKNANKSIDDYTERHNEIQGNFGEDEINSILLHVKNIMKVGEVYKEIILKDKYNNYTEIDNLYVSHNGVFIIETKNWSGNIKGVRNDDTWEQVLGNGDIIHIKENPFIQNERHVNFFNRVFHPRCDITSLVVFISNNLESIECSSVVESKDLFNYLIGFVSPVMDIEEYNNIVKKLNEFKYKPVMSHEEYVKWQREHFKK